jgi:hypothetical protein
MITLDLSILNQKGTPMFNSDIFANRPTFGIAGRIFISTDTLEIYRDTGSAWDLLGGGGGTISGTIAAGQVAFGTASNTIGGTYNLFWDNSTNRLGIGTFAPADAIEIQQSSGGGVFARIRNTSAGTGSVGGLNLINNASNTGGLYLFSSTFTPSGTRGPNTLTLFGGPNTNISVAVNSTGYYSIGTGSTETEKFRVFNNGNVLIQDGGTFTDGGQRLQIAGSSLLNGDVTFSSASGMFWDATNQRLNLGSTLPSNIATQNIVYSTPIVGVSVKNTSTSGQNQCGFFAENNLGHVGQLFKTGSSYSAYKTISANDLGFYNGTTAGDISILNDFSSGRIKFAAGGSSTAQATLFSNGNLAIASTTDTGERLQVTGTSKLAGKVTISDASTETLLVTSNSFNSRININNTNAGPNTGINLSHNGVVKWGLAAYGANADFTFYNSVLLADAFFIKGTNNNVLIGSTTDNTYKLQITGNQSITDTRTYTSGVIHSLVALRNTTFSAGSISSSTGICNYVGTGDSLINGNLTLPSSTTFGGIYQYNKYQFGSAALTFTVTQTSPGGIRAVTQLTAQNVFKGSNSGTITHVAGIQIAGFYNDNTTTITPVITNAYQLLINDTGAYGHTFSFTNRWGIYQEGINDRNYLAGNLMLNSTTDTGQILQINGAIRVNGQASGSAGGSSGNHLIINVDGTSYKIALLNP